MLVRSERQVAALRQDALARVDTALTTADRRIGGTLARVDTALGTVEALRKDLAPTIANAASITAHVNEASAILCCRDALPAQVLGLTAAAKVTMGEWAQPSRVAQKALPGFLKHGDVIAANVQLTTLRFSSVADNVDHLTKPRWYDRLLGYSLNGVVIYRNLNPATSLTVKGTQFVASRP